MYPRLASNMQLSSCISCLSAEMLGMVDAPLYTLRDCQPVIPFISRCRFIVTSKVSQDLKTNKQTKTHELLECFVSSLLRFLCWELLASRFLLAFFSYCGGPCELGFVLLLLPLRITLIARKTVNAWIPL